MLTLILLILLFSLAQGEVIYDPQISCDKFREEWIETESSLPVSINMIPTRSSCQEGQVRENPFLNDAIRRLNYYRSIAGLELAVLNHTNQIIAQECSLMLAMNQNRNSPEARVSPDPHTQHPGWVCAPEEAKNIARMSNLYNGQSVANVNFYWQTTPAHIINGMMIDTFSSKQGHRQLMLCPDSQDLAIGHICYPGNDFGSTDGRYFCGGCHWMTRAVGQNSHPIKMPSHGFVAWPIGAIPKSTVAYTDGRFFWSFAVYHQFSEEPRVTINGQNAAESNVVYALCWAYRPGESVDHLSWIRFRPSQVSLNQVLNIKVETADRQKSWTYNVQIVDCDEYPSPTPYPTRYPTPYPTRYPTYKPTSYPTVNPTKTPRPSVSPTEIPGPTVSPTETPIPTVSPTSEPIAKKNNYETAMVVGFTLLSFVVVFLCGIALYLFVRDKQKQERIDKVPQHRDVDENYFWKTFTGMTDREMDNF